MTAAAQREAEVNRLNRAWLWAVGAGVVTRWWGPIVGSFMLLGAMNSRPGEAVAATIAAALVGWAWWKWDRPRTRRAVEPTSREVEAWPKVAANGGLGRWVSAEEAIRLGIVREADWLQVLLRSATPAEGRAWIRVQREAAEGNRERRYADAPEVLDVTATEHQVTITVRPLPGQDVRRMARHSAALALAAQVRHVEIRPGAPGTVEVTLRWGDPLAAPGATTASTAPSAAGAEVIRRPPAITVGVTERGEEWRLPLSQMCLVGGVPGSGKSVFLNVALIEASRSPFVQHILIDLKGGLEFSLYEARAYRLAGNHEEAAAVIEEACAIMDARMAEMRAAGIRYFGDLQAGFTPDRPLLMVWVDEAAELFGKPPGEAKESRELASRIESGVSRLVRLSRAMGFCVVVATQKPTTDAIPSQIRDGLQERVCFRVSTVEQARAILGDPSPEMTEAATSITKDEKGYAVVRSEDGDWVRARGGFLSDDEVATTVRSMAHLRAELIV